MTTLGSTNLAVSRIGLGLAALGRPGYINLGHAADLAGHTDVASMERGAHAVLDAAYAGGVRYFDAARSYGKAEAFLASWLRERGLGPDDLVVGSKWGYTYTAGWRVDAPVHEVKDLSVETLRRQYAESTELLGSNLRLYQIHSATLDSGVLDDRAVLDELARLRAGGLSIGLSVTGPRQAETIERALEVGGFDALQATWNVLERTGRPGARGRPRRGPRRDRQGGARERAADRARWDRRARGRRAGGRKRRLTRSRSRRCWRSRGRTSSSAVPPPSTSSTAT